MAEKKRGKPPATKEELAIRNEANLQAIIDENDMRFGEVGCLNELLGILLDNVVLAEVDLRLYGCAFELVKDSCATFGFADVFFGKAAGEDEVFGRMVNPKLLDKTYKVHKILRLWEVEEASG